MHMYQTKKKLILVLELLNSFFWGGGVGKLFDGQPSELLRKLVLGSERMNE
jgi:hypothetical protein